MEPIRLSMLTLAKGMVRLNVAEHPKGHNAGEIVSKIIELQGGHDGDPYCAAGWAFMYELAHDVTKTQKAFDPGLSTSGIVRAGKAANRLTTMPFCGDAVCYIGGPTGYYHTGMFGEWIDKNAGTFWTIEFNVGDAVLQKTRNTHTTPAVFISCL